MHQSIASSYFSFVRKSKTSERWTLPVNSTSKNSINSNGASFSLAKSLSNSWHRTVPTISPEVAAHSSTEPAEMMPPILSAQQETSISTRRKPNRLRKNSTDVAEIISGLCCDKCDGKHETASCPYYKRQRENHPDAQKGAWKKIGGTSNLPGAFISNARVAKQPGDGSCLFHSMSYGLRDGTGANHLREEICSFILRNPHLEISETPISEWVRWDSGTSVSDYIQRMARGAWGGGIEMATVSKMKSVNVHVYERYRGGFKRISAFDYPESPETKKIIRVLYCGGVHYGIVSCSFIFC